MSTLFKKKITACFCASACIFVATHGIAYADTATKNKSEGLQKKKPGQYRTFLVYFENDLFADTDQYYTNAVKLTWLTKDVREYRQVLPKWLMPATHLAPPISPPYDENLVTLYNVAFSLGQDIYTPDNIEPSVLLKNERPYAGWLYGGLALHRKTVTRLDTFEISIGIVGPSSLGEESQNSVHRYRNIDEANGWDHQLNDEPGLLLTWQRHSRMASMEKQNGFSTDFIPHYGVTLGNVLSAFNIGTEYRIGYHIPKDFGTSLIRPGSILSDPFPGANDSNSTSFGFHFFFGVDGRAVGQNIFLDGNTWKDSHSVDKKTFVMDAYGGIAVHYRRFKITYTHVWRSKEFSTQDKPQLFGSLSLRYTF